MKFDPKTDTAGPLSLGVAASKNVRPKKRAPGRDRQFRFRLQSSRRIRPSNGDLFYNTVDWLAQDENLISIRPKTAANRAITLTESQAALLKWFDLLFLPGIVIFSGIVIWWKRR